MSHDPVFIFPAWDVPENIRAVCTSRVGGYSQDPWRGFNLGDHVGDDAVAVADNRRLLRQTLKLPADPKWLNQVHGTRVRLPDQTDSCADACFEDHPRSVCAVLTADCLPVLFCNHAGTRVAAAHAGWRGLLGGVLESTVACFSDPPDQLFAWLGPAIGPEAFEVGDEVRKAFIAERPAAEACFRPHGQGHWLADLYGLARLRLTALGMTRISGGEYCTYGDAERFFSYRRDGITGRMASLIWRQS